MCPLEGEAKRTYMRRYHREHAEERQAYARRYRESHQEKVKADRRKRYYKNRDDALARVKVWTLENLERKKAYMRDYGEAYRAVNRERIWAQGLARQVPLEPTCEKCGATEHLEKHHPDYSKPLEVLTLCRSCHMRLHRGLVEA